MRRGSVWQLDGLPATPTQNLPRDRWLALRRNGIGGSDIAGIVGISPWTTPLAVYCEKVGLAPDRDPTDAMEFGRRMEPTLRRWAQSELRARAYVGATVLASPYLYQHPTEPLFMGNLDGLVVMDGAPVAGLELKTVDRFAGRDWEGDAVPPYYVAQAQWYMGVTDLPLWFFGALIGKRFALRRVVRDAERVAELQQAARRFWEENVLPRVQPPAEGADTDLLISLYGEAGEDVLQVPAMAETCAQYLGYKARAKEAEQEAETHKARIEQCIGDARGLQAGRFTAMWSRFDVTRVDGAKLKAEHPEVHAAVAKTSRSGRLTVKEEER